MNTIKVLLISVYVLWKWKKLGLEHFLEHSNHSKKNKRKIDLITLNKLGAISEHILYQYPFKKVFKPTCLKLALIQFYMARRYEGEVVFIIGFKRYLNDGKKQLGGHAWILIDGQQFPNNFDDSVYVKSYSFRKDVC